MMDRSERVIRRGARHELRVLHCPGAGLDICEWFKAKDGTWRPGSKGVTLSGEEVNVVAEMMRSSRPRD